MPHNGVRPAYGGGIERWPIVSFERFHPERWSGVLQLVWTIPEGSPVAIGAGRLTVRTFTEGRRRRARVAGRWVVIEPEEHHEVLSEIVRRGANRAPVLPGSSLKGSVRQAYELLTPSCDPFGGGRCQVRQKEPNPSVCPACSLFGGQGLAGRLAFLEATPVAKACWFKPVAVAKGWQPRRPVAGAYRVYGPGRARDRDGNVQPRDDKTYSVYGKFTSRLRVKDATDDELGLLFAALGLPAESGPGLRLGGRKFDGFGECTVSVAEVVQRRPAAARTAGEEAQSWALDLAGKALDADGKRRQTFDALHRALQGKKAEEERDEPA